MTSALDIYRGCPRHGGRWAALVATEAAIDIYRAYPRHVGRRAALAAIKAAMGRAASEVPCQSVGEYLMERVRAYAVAVQGREKQYIPHPATWFNRDSWADDPAEWNVCPVTPEERTAAANRAANARESRIEAARERVCRERDAADRASAEAWRLQQVETCRALLATCRPGDVLRVKFPGGAIHRYVVKGEDHEAEELAKNPWGWWREGEKPVAKTLTPVPV